MFLFTTMTVGNSHFNFLVIALWFCECVKYLRFETGWVYDRNNSSLHQDFLQITKMVLYIVLNFPLCLMALFALLILLWGTLPHLVGSYLRFRFGSPSWTMSVLDACVSYLTTLEKRNWVCIVSL